ncbi:hypothetical protein [Sanguibacter massiliensis]|uniref:hypothetical protein n=1 Tax=Sanguibacter massiliensis TaxID=1973217 RepID=UPI000C823F31|nr:hypothetical protein [Sanguibacter massiliensis]
MTRTPDPAALAPHVEPSWLDAFVLALRVHGVPGTLIGDALAEVESHCAEAGEPAAEAFGDPVAYAQSLELAPDESLESEIRWGGVWSGLQLVALFAVPAAVRGLVRGEPVNVTGGMLLMVVLLLGIVAALGVKSTWAMRTVVERPGLASIILGASLTAVVLPSVLWRTVVVSLPVVPVLVVAALLLVVGTTRSVRTLGAPDDIVGPSDPRSARLRLPFSAFLMPLGTIVLAIIAALTA